LEDLDFLTFEQAKAAKFQIDFDAAPPAPALKMLGTTVIDTVKIADIVAYILESFLPDLGAPWALPQP
jgi:hypothetical protein